MRYLLKRFISILLAVNILCGSLPIVCAAEYEDGSTSLLSDSDATMPQREGNTYKITSANELRWVAEQTAGDYHFQDEVILLMEDIDLQGGAWTGIGYNLNHYFSGTFNGNGHTIRGFEAKGNVDSFTIINAPRHTTGLFGVCNKAKIQNVILEDIELNLHNDSGYQNDYSSIDGTNIFGGIVCGYAVESQFQNIIVRKSSVTISTGAEAAGAYAGGIVGYAEHCNFAHCGNEGAAVQAVSDSMSNNAFAGGIVGKLNNEGIVRQCWNTAQVVGNASIATAYAGGIIGMTENTSTTLSAVRDCYNQGGVSYTGNLMSSGFVGGVIGFSSSTVNRCYNSGDLYAKASYIGKTVLGGIIADGIATATVSNCAVMAGQITGSSTSYLIGGAGAKENNIAITNLSAQDDASLRCEKSSFYGSNVYIKDLSWQFPQIWEEHANAFPTLRYIDANMEQDILAVDEAAKTVDIQFAQGDYYNKVTQNIILLGDKSLADIRWESSNETVISSQGEVYRQPESYQVKLTAIISSGQYRVEKRFILNVIGQGQTIAVESADWAMNPDQAKTFVANMKGCRFDQVGNDDPDFLVLTGQNTDETDVISTMANIMSYWEVPEESAYLKRKMGNVIDLIKSGKDKEISALVSDFSDGWVKWDTASDSAQVNKTTVVKNLCKIPLAMYNVQVDLVKGYDSIKKLTEVKFEDTNIENTLVLGEKIGKVFDCICETADSSAKTSFSTRKLSISKTAGTLKNVWELFQLWKAYESTKQNKAKAYLKVYMESRPAFESAEDPAFQLWMDMHITTSMLTQEELEQLETMAEQLYQMYKKFGGGLDDEYKITIRCPVDVAVFNASGKLVGRVTNNVIDRSISNALYITVGGENNDEKTIYFQDKEPYSISLIANDAGTMNIEMECQMPDGTTAYSYNDIALDSGKTMNLDIETRDFYKSEGEPPQISVIKDGVETNELKPVDNTTFSYPLKVYPCIEEGENIILSAVGGYGETDSALPGTSLKTLIHSNSGYRLVGLYLDAGCKELYSQTTMPSEALTLYAKFEINHTGIILLTQPENGTYQQNDVPQQLKVDTDDDTKYHFQWYCYTDNKSEATPIINAEETVYLPETSKEGTVFYFVRVFLNGENEDVFLDSDSAQIVVTKKQEYASGTCGSGLTWVLTKDGLLEVSGSGAMEDYAEGEAPWENYKRKIIKVVLEEGITHLGNYAFAGCKYIREFQAPNSLDSVGIDVLKNCTDLVKMTIPFVGANRTASQTKEAVLGYWFGIAQTGITQYYMLSGNSLSGYTYGIPDSLRNVILTDTTSIPFGAFYNCSQLTSVTLKDGVTELDKYSFRNCNGLTEITLPDSVQVIQEGAFSGCIGLERISIPFVGKTRTSNNTYESVLGHIFGRSQKGDSQTVTQYYALDGESLKGYQYGIPANLQEILITDAVQLPCGSFSNLQMIQTLRLNTGINRIEDCAFYQCEGLADVYYEDFRSKWDAIIVGDYNDQLLKATIHCLELEKSELKGTPVIDNCNPQVGDILTASNGITNSEPEKISYEWYRGENLIVKDSEGSYTVTAEDIGYSIKVRISAANYSGWIESTPTAEVMRINITDAAIEIKDGKSFVYDGEAKQPAIIVKVGKQEIEPSEYIVSYGRDGKEMSEAKNAGNYSIIVTAKPGSKYTGTVSKSPEFTIAPQVVNKIVLKYAMVTYDGITKKPDVTVFDLNGHKVDNAEYSVKYKDNMNIGMATVTILDVPGGNYEVNGSADFEITCGFKWMLEDSGKLMLTGSIPDEHIIYIASYQRGKLIDVKMLLSDIKVSEPVNINADADEIVLFFMNNLGMPKMKKNKVESNVT